MSLNTHSPIPLYRQLAERIRADISRGSYQVDEKIPSENVLAKQYAIGRPTVRQATDLLVRQGILQRRRGSGTFVLPPTKQVDLFSLAGTSNAFSQSELNAHTELVQTVQLLEKPRDNCPPPLAEKQLYTLTRLSHIDQEPVLLEVFYLDADLFHGLEQQLTDNDSLAKVVRDKYFLEATEAEQAFAIRYPEAEIANWLDVRTSTPLLHVARTLHFGEHQAAIYCDIYCRTDRFHFSQTISQTQNTPPNSTLGTSL